MTNHYQDIKKQFEELHKQYFAILSIDCKKCGHNKNSHYWNGGGNQAQAGYDRCRVENCKCIDYDEDSGFGEVVKGYDTEYEKLLSFLQSALVSQLEEVERVVKEKFNVYYRSKFSQDCSREETEEEKNTEMIKLSDLLLTLKQEKEKIKS